MRIRMKVTQPGSRDGSRTERFEAGSVYDLGHTPREVDLACVFVLEGWAEELLDGSSGPPEEKAPAAASAAPATQARPAAPRNKGR